MNDLSFSEEDVYCIENFGYNTTGEYDKIKQLESKDHLVIEELEYRLKQREEQMEKARNYIKNNIVDYITNYDDLRENLLEILKEV